MAHTSTTILPTKHRPLTLKTILHVPKIQHNVFSVSQLCRENNYKVVFDSSCACIKDNTTGDVKLQASGWGAVYTVLVCDLPTSVLLMSPSLTLESSTITGLVIVELAS